MPQGLRGFADYRGHVQVRPAHQVLPLLRIGAGSLECIHELQAGGVAAFWLFPQPAPKHGVNVRAQRRIQPLRRRRFFGHDLVHHGGEMFAGERPLTGQHFVGNDGQRKLVGAPAHGEALHLLRRHVIRRSDNGSVPVRRQADFCQRHQFGVGPASVQAAVGIDEVAARRLKMWFKGQKRRQEMSSPQGPQIQLLLPDGLYLLMPGSKEAVKMPLPAEVKATGGQPFGDIEQLKRKSKKVGSEKVGRYKAVGRIGALTFRGFLAWWLARTYHLSQIPGAYASKTR